MRECVGAMRLGGRTQKKQFSGKREGKIHPSSWNSTISRALDCCHTSVTWGGAASVLPLIDEPAGPGEEVRVGLVSLATGGKTASILLDVEWA